MVQTHQSRLTRSSAPSVPWERVRVAWQRWLRHGVALLLVFAAGVTVHRPVLTAERVGLDEAAYLRTIALVAEGASPYREPEFMYTPPFAIVATALHDALGARFLPVLRRVNLAGVALLAWAALVGSAWSWWHRVAAALLLVCGSPLVADGLWHGNVSLLMLGLLVAGLTLCRSMPWAGGALVGSVNALKPMGVTALALLLVPGPERRPPGWGLRALAAAVAAATLWLLVGIRHLPEMTSRAGGLPDALTNISLARALYALGWQVHPALVFAAVSAGAVAVAWGRALSPRQRLVLASSASLLALPINNPNTFVFSFPAQLLALEVALGQLRAAQRGGERLLRPVLAAALVSAAIVSVNGAKGVAAAGHLTVAAQGLVTLIPLAAVAGLTLYSLGHGSRRPKATE